MSPRAKAKILLVICESLAGTGHKINRLKYKGSDKLEFLHKDPIVQQNVLYKEMKKLKTISSKEMKRMGFE